MRNKVIAVIGAGSCDAVLYARAEQLGRLLAAADYIIICGGLGGVMEGVCQGAAEANGLTIGILPGDEAGAANPYVSIVIPSGMGIGRNLLIIRAADAVIALNGGYGTLSEIAFALQLEKPLIGLGTWQISDRIIIVDSPEAAIETLSTNLR
jgi:uncharacterized protein (TIGR00725 family)